MNNSWRGDIVSPAAAAATCAHGVGSGFRRGLCLPAHLTRNVLRRRQRAARGYAGQGAVRRGAEGGGAAPPDAAVLLGACSGASGGLGDDAEPLTKRHIDGIFTDSYSRYRKQMAVKKYLAAVLGKRYKQRVKNKGRRVAYL